MFEFMPPPPAYRSVLVENEHPYPIRKAPQLLLSLIRAYVEDRNS